METKELSYKFPPLVEATCELRFKAESWNWTIPGLVFNKLRETFPVVVEESALRVSIPKSEASSAGLHGTPERILLSTDDRSRLVILAPRLLALSERKYSRWSEFKNNMITVLQAYSEIAGDAPLERVGMRYIDRIVIDNTRIQLEDYFTAPPQVPAGVPDLLGQFLVHLRIKLPDEAGSLTYRLFTDSAQPENSVAFKLDCDLYAVDTECPTLDKLFTWLDHSHTIVKAAFERSFTDKTHIEVFGGIQK